jgi:hypothetical protein
VRVQRRWHVIGCYIGLGFRRSSSCSSKAKGKRPPIYYRITIYQQHRHSARLHLVIYIQR